MEIKNVIITGAGGFIGNAVTRLLLSKNIKVYAIDINVDNLKDIIENPNLVFIKAGFEDYIGLQQLVKESIDVWFHFAFMGGFEGASLKDYNLQLMNTKYACDAVNIATELKVKKFIFASTVNEIEALGYLNAGFTSPRYTCIYSAAKIATEIIGKTIAYNNNMEFVTGLISMPYGEKNYAKTLPNIIINQINNLIKPKLIEGNNKYDLVYIDDVANAFYYIAIKGLNLKSYYIGHRNLKTFKELITEIRDILNSNVGLSFGEYKDSIELDYSMIDLDGLYNDTGFECETDFRESILKTAEWLKSIESK